VLLSQIVYDEESMFVELAHGAHLVILKEDKKSALDVICWGCVHSCVELCTLSQGRARRMGRAKLESIQVHWWDARTQKRSCRHTRVKVRGRKRYAKESM
jgi:hypothetical protein